MTTPYKYAPTLYDECVKRGIPIRNHESDLFIPKTDETFALIVRYGHDRNGARARACTFTNRVEGGTWYDVPFGYAPYWRERIAR